MKEMDIAIIHILTMQRNCLGFDWELILGKQLILNRNKYEWETLNTPKIKVVFYSNERYAENDYGTKLRIKCHQRIQRKAKTIESELCTNWELIDSFGQYYKNKFYHDPDERRFTYESGWFTFESGIEL